MGQEEAAAAVGEDEAALAVVQVENGPALVQEEAEDKPGPTSPTKKKKRTGVGRIQKKTENIIFPVLHEFTLL